MLYTFRVSTSDCAQINYLSQSVTIYLINYYDINTQVYVGTLN